MPNRMRDRNECQSVLNERQIAKALFEGRLVPGCRLVFIDRYKHSGRANRKLPAMLYATVPRPLHKGVGLSRVISERLGRGSGDRIAKQVSKCGVFTVLRCLPVAIDYWA